jgi:hypothetical protein
LGDVLLFINVSTARFGPIVLRISSSTAFWLIVLGMLCPKTLVASQDNRRQIDQDGQEGVPSVPAH